MHRYCFVGVVRVQRLCQILFLVTVIVFQQAKSQAEGPNLTCPEDIIAETNLGEVNISVSWPAATLSNRTDLEIKLGDHHPGPGTVLSIGEYNITYFAVDAIARANCTFTINVVAWEPPDISNCPENIKSEYFVTDITAQGNKIKIPERPLFSDNSGVTPNVTSNVPGDEGTPYLFPIGLTDISYTATDQAGNQKTCEYSVEVMLAPPVNVWNISIKEYNSSCITLIWKQVQVSQYDVVYQIANDNSTQKSTYQSGDDSRIFVEKEICGLLAGTQYLFEVQPTSQAIVPFRIEQRTKPLAAKNLTKTNSDATSISISWTNAQDSAVDQFHLFYHELDKEDVFIDLGYVPKAINSFTFSNLHPSVTYLLYVEAVVASGEHRTTNEASLMAHTEAIPVDTFLVVRDFTESTITVVWANHDTAQTILLFIQKTSTEIDTQFYPLFPGSSDYQPTYKFTDLDESTEYTIYLVINGENAIRANVTQQTRPSRITDLVVCNMPTSITLTWTPTSKSYECRISPYDEEPIRTSNTECNFTNLQANTDYYVQVVSLNTDGLSSVPWTDIVRTDTVQLTNKCVEKKDGVDDEELYLVYVVTGAAGVFILILLVVICGLLCMIPCEEEIPPIPPAATYPNGSADSKMTHTEVTPGGMHLHNDPNGNKHEHFDVEDPYHTVGTYRNMFGRKVKPRGYSFYRRKNDANFGSEQESSDIYENVAAETALDEPRYPDPASEMSQAISRNFEALNQDYSPQNGDNNRISMTNTTM